MQRNSCGTARRKALDKCLRKSYTICVVKNIWAYSSAGSASVSLLCPTELWAFKWGVCRLVAQPSHAPKYGPIAQLGERTVRIRKVVGSNPFRSTKAEPDEPRGRLALLLSLQSIWSAESSFWSVRSTRKNKKEATAQDCSCAVASLCFFHSHNGFRYNLPKSSEILKSLLESTVKEHGYD